MGSLPGAVRINLSTALGHGTGDSLADLLDPTAGTGEASKFLLLDSSGNVTLPGTVGVTGATTLTGGLLTDTTAPVAVETAEHGAGAVGTGVAPATYRYTRDGVIITEIQVDLAGLKCKGSTAKDAIGLTGAAYIGRYVTAT